MGRIVPGEVRAMLDELSEGGEKGGKSLDDQLWRTLVVDRGLDEKEIPFWYQNACAGTKRTEFRIWTPRL